MTHTPLPVLRLRRDATVTDGRIDTPFGVLPLKQLPPGAAAALTALSTRDTADNELAALVVAGDGEGGLMRWHLLHARLAATGLLEHAVTGPDGQIAARLVPRGRGSTALASWPAGADPVPVRLSRFALLRTEDAVLTLQAPGSHLAVELAPAAASLLGQLGDWTKDLPAPLLRLLATAGLLTRADHGPDGLPADPETTGRGPAQWHPLDLAFHSRTRTPAAASGYGGTYPGKARFEPEPAAAPLGDGPRITLDTPDLDQVAARDPSLTQVLEARTSRRAHDDERPLTVEQLAELLYRTLRIRSVFTGSDGQELADRPYPSGGAVHELEVYPLVTSCRGLDPGLYRYAADRHELEHVAVPGPATAALVKEARDAAMMRTDPQVVLLVAARFGRVMWKYETVAYPLILKHVGVLYQTLYLTAEAMGLAACGLGGGDTTAFAAATGRDPLLEGSVGELVIGSRAPEPAESAPEPAAAAAAEG